jgi:hypothetical protein
MQMNDDHKEGSVEAIVAGAVSAPGLDDLLSDYAELGLDQLIDADTVSDIPIVRSVVAVVRMGIGIRNRLFARKLLDFLTGFRGISEWERHDMVSRLEADPAYGRRVGEHLTELLDRIESHKKPKMLARVFRAYADKTIDGTMLQRLCVVIERVPSFEIPAFRSYCETAPEKRSTPIVTLQNLQAAGLFTVDSYAGGLGYNLNEVGEQFLTLELDRLV